MNRRVFRNYLASWGNSDVAIFKESIEGNVSPLNADNFDSIVLLFVLVVSTVIAVNGLSPCNSSTSFSSLLSILGCRSKSLCKGFLHAY